MVKRWKVRDIDGSVAERLAAATGLTGAMARVLVGRGIDSPSAADAFLNPDRSDLFDPFSIKDMDRAVTRIHTAVERNEKVLVFGDYDVDGISSAALLVETLQSMGLDVAYEVPDRLIEGYGLNTDRVRAAADRGVDLIVTVDNGISCQEEVTLARELGLDIIVTDHHEPGGDRLPPAVAVLDPKRPDATYPHRDLAGVGVSAKLCQALTGRTPPLDLVALGTVADVVPLLGENRTLVSRGIDELRTGNRVGLKSLAEVAAINPADIRAYHIAFQLGPRINAAGRLGKASDSIELLLASDKSRADVFAHQLDRDNRDRQQICDRIREDAESMMSLDFSSDQRTIMLAAPGWHPGIIGIVASRIAEEYHRPTVLLAIDGDHARGSARSIRAFDLFSAISECSDLIDKFGGHKYAAGLTVRSDRIDELRDRFEAVGRRELSDDDMVPEVTLDTWVEPNEITETLATELDRIEPYGHSNPRPLFGVRAAEPTGYVRLMRNDSARFALRCGNRTLNAVAFRMPELKNMLEARLTLDIAFLPVINVWRDRREFQLTVKHVRPTVRV